ncbi:MAG: hypothetical protein JSV49_07085 [Thermoplasmata archaeon]|nr:MAG: hypothetical protein JSV49_07085 [Thermoplasmata archaeon]
MPLTQFMIWGSDTGEYYYLTTHLEEENKMVEDYNGWGLGYPSFPGMFYLNVEVSELTGLDPFYTLLILTPTLSAFSVIFVFMLTRRFGGSEGAGLVAAAIVAVAMPVVYATSHAMPGTLGDLLALVCILAFLQSYRNQMYFPLLALCTLALLITHHLSTFIFLIAIITMVIFREILKRPNITFERLKIDLIYIFILLNLILVYWLLYAVPFRERVIMRSFGTAGLMYVIAMIYVGFAVFVTLMFMLRKYSTYTYQPTEHSTRRHMIYFIIAVSICLLAILIASMGLLPTLDITPDPLVFIYLLPLAVLFSLGILGPNESLRFTNGIYMLAWISSIGIALLLTMILGSHSIIIYRYAQYAMEPWAISIGLGTMMIIGTYCSGVRSDGDRKTNHSASRFFAVVFIIAILILGTAATAYPPRSVMSGFQEGITDSEMDGVLWCRSNIEAGSTVATDHRLSSMLFGFAGLNASWDYVEKTFYEEDFEDVRDELNRVSLPSGRKQIDYVMLSDELREGVALVQWKQAEPMSEEAAAKFQDNPFYVVYDSGDVQIYQIDWKYDID